MTAHWTREVHTRAADVNMAAVLLKPCAPAHLAAELRRVLGVVRRASLAESPVRPARGIHPRDA
jgi:hypothetical protein